MQCVQRRLYKYTEIRGRFEMEVKQKMLIFCPFDFDLMDSERFEIEVKKLIVCIESAVYILIRIIQTFINDSIWSRVLHSVCKILIRSIYVLRNTYLLLFK